MRAYDVGRLALLATLWSLQFLGPVELSGRMLLAAGSISFAALIMSPAWALAPSPQAWTPEATGALLALGIVCSGIAYLPFFTLLRDIGPSRTLSVTFLVPVLGVFWGWLFLDEAVTAAMLAGAALVLGALSLVLRR